MATYIDDWLIEAKKENAKYLLVVNNAGYHYHLKCYSVEDFKFKFISLLHMGSQELMWMYALSTEDYLEVSEEDAWHIVHSGV